MPAPSVPEHFSEQSGWCDRLGSPFTAGLLLLMKADFEANGVIYDLAADWPGNPRADVLGLRLAGALHYAVLTGMSDRLVSAYPGERGTAASLLEVWPAASDFFRAHFGWAQDFIQSPPQTNETRRAFMLLIGLKTIARRFEMPVHLLELGASAGLNLNFDAFHYDAGSWQWGDPASPMKVTTNWQAPIPDLSAPLDVRSRKACDQNPLDLTDTETRLRLKSYIWPDQPERLARFDAAVGIALQRNTKVEKADAADWLARELSIRPEGVVTVVFHSVFFQYPPVSTRQRLTELIETAGESATADAPLVWLRYEPENVWTRSKEINAANMTCDLRLWPGDEHIVFARSDGHVREVYPA